MPVKTITTEFGHAMPPEGKHTITVHTPGWQTIMAFRDGDANIFKKIKSIYPRFSPWAEVRKFVDAIRDKLDLPETTGVLAYTSPDVFGVHQEYTTSSWRKQDKLVEGELDFKVADINGVRLYIVTYPSTKSKGIIGAWQNPGLGISSRAAEYLLPHVSDLQLADWSGDLANLPPPTYFPENGSHAKLRERITSLIHRAPIDPAKVKVTPDDVFLYSTGMSAIYYLNKALLKRHSGTVLVLGSVFHNTWHLFEEAPNGMKHFGDCRASSGILDKVEEYLEEETKKGNKISYLFTEFPSNPIVVCVDLIRLRQLADKYDFILVVDDTIGSFCNLDLMPVADMVMTSLTKSFSGYSNVMGGSVILNPDSPRYDSMKQLFTSTHYNEFFAGDADVLLSNSADYLPRSAILNRNAAAVAALLQKEADGPASLVKGVLYPPQVDTHANYRALMRPATPDFTPGYGCLLGVDMRDVATAISFFDNLAFHNGPHLGAQLSLALPYGAMMNGAFPETSAYHSAYGVLEEQIRLSVGLEDEEDMIDTVQFALEKAREPKEVKKAPAGDRAETESPQAVAVAKEVSANFQA